MNFATVFSLVLEYWYRFVLYQRMPFVWSFHTLPWPAMIVFMVDAPQQSQARLHRIHHTLQNYFGHKDKENSIAKSLQRVAEGLHQKTVKQNLINWRSKT